MRFPTCRRATRGADNAGGAMCCCSRVLCRALGGLLSSPRAHTFGVSMSSRVTGQSQTERDTGRDETHTVLSRITGARNFSSSEQIGLGLWYRVIDLAPDQASIASDRRTGPSLPSLGSRSVTANRPGASLPLRILKGGRFDHDVGNPSETPVP